MPPHASLAPAPAPGSRRLVYLLLAALAAAPFLLLLLYGGASPAALCLAASRYAPSSRRLPYPSVLWSRVAPLPALPSSPVPSLRASRWIIFSASAHHPHHRPLPAVPGWQLLAVADEATPPDWSHPGATVLTLADQARLGFRSVAFLSERGHARKAAAYLFAVQRGARVIYDADARNAVAGGNLTEHFDVDLDQRQGGAVLLQYSHADPNRTVVNPYVHFGQPSVWPRGLPLEKAGEVGMEEFYTEVFGGGQFIQQGLCNGLPDVDAVFYFTRKSSEMEAFDVRFDADAPKVALPQGMMAPVNSLNTLFHSPAFWGLALPVSVSPMASDVIRGYWAQRILWEIGGYVVIYPPTVHRIDNVHAHPFDDERDIHVNAGRLINFLMEWRSNKRTLFERILDLSYAMAEEGFWGEKDLQFMAAWLQDLVAVGYQQPRLMSLEIDRPRATIGHGDKQEFVPKKLPSVHLGVEEIGEVSTEIGNLIKWRKHFGDIVLIVHCTGPVDRIALEWRLLYGRIFRAVVILSEQGNSDLAVESSNLAQAYKILPKVFDRFAGAEGFLFLQDHMVLNYWNLLDADKAKLWITNKVKESWSDVPLRGNKIEWFMNQGDMVKQAVRSFPFHYQANYKRSVGEDKIIHCSSEIFYIPRRHIGDLSYLVKVIGSLDIHHSIAQRSDSGAEKLGGGSSGALRIGAQNNSAVMSKRVRSSLADGRLEGRGSVPTRQGPLVNNDKSSPLEKEKSCARTSGTVSGLSEEKLRGLSAGGEGWEKKQKRKRSVGTMLNRGNDADRDVKPVGQHKPANEARLRSSDGLAYRHGAPAGAVGSKMDGSSQQNNTGSRILSKMDVDYATLPNERRERLAGIEKERAMVKGNKEHISEDMQTGSLSPLPKAKACRAPRTSSLVMGSSSSFQRSAGGNDEWEETPYSNKTSPLGGMTNRKRSTHSNASSPPITWVGQRPQKISRTRRANVVSPVSNFDEVLSEGSPLDTAARSAPVESCGVLLTKNVTNHTQTVTKMDNISPAGLSESEGWAATESKAKEKVTNSGEVENEGANAVHNATGLIFSSNKNRIPLKEEPEDGGVRRQGRSGRGTMHVKGCSSISKEKLDTTETRKSLKGGRPGPEKNESKVGRPLMKKGSDGKSSSCYAQALNCESTDISGQPEDDREELLAAANAARSAIIGAYSGPFWKKMEPMLTFVSSEKLALLKHQINLVEELEMSMSCMPDGEHNVIASTDYSRLQTMEELSSQVLAPSNSSLLPEERKTNGVGTKGPIDYFSPSDENRSTGPPKVEADKWFHEMAPMAHILLSALIMEDDFSDSNGVQRDILVEFSNSHIPYTANRYLENEPQASAITSNFGLSVDFTHSNNTLVVHQSMCNGHTASSNVISSNSQNSVHSENLSDGVSFAGYPENGPLHDLIPHISRQCQNPGNFFPSPPYDYHYGQMSLNDKVLIELQSIGICPETVPKLDDGEDQDINKMISELRKRLHDQVKQKKCKLHKLDKAIQDTKSIEERSLEQHAMNKLVERAYKKLKGGRVGSSHKAGVSKYANKAAKQLALAFAKRTLARCQKFEETKKSCFSEPSLWSVLSAPLPSSDAKSTEGVERLKLQKLDRSPLDQGGTKWKKSDKERDHNRDASAKGSGLKSGRHSSGSGRSGERKNKTKPKQKLAQLSTSGNVLGRVVGSFPTPATQEPPEPAGPSSAKITQQPRNTPGSTARRSTDAALTNLPGLDDILDVPGGLDGQGNDISSWFTDGLDDPLDIDLSGALEIPDDDLTQLGFV